MGLLNERIDFEIISALARYNDQWKIVLVGPIYSHLQTVTRTIEQLPRRHGNVFLLGEKDYTSLPDYVAGFDVCVIPYKTGPYADGINPLKLYQYLAAGKPVVSTPLPSVAKFADVVSIEAQPNAFGRAVDLALARGRDIDSVRVCRQVAYRFSWTRVALQRLQIINDHISRREGSQVRTSDRR